MALLCEAPPKAAVRVAVWVVAMEPADTVKAAELAPAGTTIEAGAASPALPDVRVTELPPAGASAFRMTVQVLEALAARLLGLHASEVTWVPGPEEPLFRLRVTLCDPPFTVAVMTAVWAVVNVPMVTWKDADLMPANIIRLVGTLTTGLLLVSANDVKLVVAVVRVTVQLVVPAAVKVVVVQVMDDTVKVVVRVKVVLCELLFNVAVTVAVELLLRVPVVALKVAVVAPADTVTEAGTVKAAELVLVRATSEPPAGAAPLRVTVQVLELLELRALAVQASDDTVTDAGAVRVTMVLAEVLL